MLAKPSISVLSMIPAASAAEYITAFIIPQYVIKYKSFCDVWLNSANFFVLPDVPLMPACSQCSFYINRIYFIAGQEFQQLVFVWNTVFLNSYFLSILPLVLILKFSHDSIAFKK